MLSADELKIQALEAQLVALRAQTQAFMATVVHDLRAPVRHLVSYSTLLLEDFGAGVAPESLEMLQALSQAARTLGAQMDALAALARLGAVEVQKAPVSLSALLQELQISMRGAYPAVLLQWSQGEDLPTLHTDASMLRQALLPILDNAMKFGRPQQAVQIAVQAQRMELDGALSLEIQDQGQGFPSHVAVPLFRPFQRLHQQQELPGLGMGLAMAHRAVERLGGSLTVQASASGGCRVQLLLPQN